MPFTPEELEAVRLADEEIDREFDENLNSMLADEYVKNGIDKWLDELAVLDRLDGKQRRARKYQRQYREANKDAIAEYQRQYREANKDAIAEQRRQKRRKRRLEQKIFRECRRA